jgi:hypothetical protein
MRLSLRSVGGFTGPAGAQTHTVELDRLPPREAERLRALVRSLDFAALTATLTKPRPQSWDFLHTLEISDNGQHHQLRFHSEAAPPALAELAELLGAYPPDPSPDPPAGPQPGPPP